MSILSRLFQRAPDPKEQVRPLWHQLVRVARTREFYSECGVADTLDGRFDMLSTILAVAMLRMERDPETLPAAARLTELFVEDMDGQLRESGVGDPTVGKQLGKLVSALGGRTGALRDSLKGDDTALIAAVERNVTLREDGSAACIAAKLRGFAKRLDDLSYDELLTTELTL